MEKSLLGSFLLRRAKVLMPDKAKGWIACSSGQRRFRPIKLAEKHPSVVEGAPSIFRRRGVVYCIVVGHVVAYDVDDLGVRGHGEDRCLLA